MKTIKDKKAAQLLYNSFIRSEQISPVYVRIGESPTISAYTLIYLPKNIVMICTPFFITSVNRRKCLNYNNLYDVGDDLILVNTKHKVFTSSIVNYTAIHFSTLLREGGFTRLDSFTDMRKECNAFCPLAKKCKDYLKVIMEESSLTLQRCDPTPFLSKPAHANPAKVWVDQLVQAAYKDRIDHHIKQMEVTCNGDISISTSNKRHKSKS